MPKNKTESYIKLKDMENLLSEQTDVILSAVDEKLVKMEIKFDEKLAKMEARINTKIEKLTDTLDKFLKWMTDLEDEFEIMEHDINRIKNVVKEKLGVNLL